MLDSRIYKVDTLQCMNIANPYFIRQCCRLKLGNTFYYATAIPSIFTFFVSTVILILK